LNETASPVFCATRKGATSPHFDAGAVSAHSAAPLRLAVSEQAIQHMGVHYLITDSDAAAGSLGFEVLESTEDDAHARRAVIRI
jgi:hypothetical protein